MNAVNQERIQQLARDLASAARRASRTMAKATTRQKDSVLLRIADALVGRARDRILSANAVDVVAAEDQGLSKALVDRLRLDEMRVNQIAEGVRAVRDLPDPVGAIENLVTRPSGIQVGRMRVPLGVILMIYESRPNVTIDAAALCLKAGNAVILRGGKEAVTTNRSLASVVQDALAAEDLPDSAATFVDDPERELLYALLRKEKDVDLAIPRGGTALIDAVNQHARIPVVQHYQGICHVYVHAQADLHTATKLCVNAKVQRPGVCNAAEGVVVDAAIADAFLPHFAEAMAQYDVELRCCERSLSRVAGRAKAKPAAPEDFDTEFLDLVCSVKVVDDVDDALEFLAAHGTRHTETIATQDYATAQRFLREVDASCVLVNASTRFNDGFELGLGAELGISTTKLHAYGPMGLEELCAKKFVVYGGGQTRGTPP